MRIVVAVLRSAVSPVGLSCYFGNFCHFHLLSNGKERTLLAHFLPMSDAEREILKARVNAEQQERAAAWQVELEKRRANPTSHRADTAEPKQKADAAKSKAAAAQDA